MKKDMTFDSLYKSVSKLNKKSLSYRNLKLYRQFYKEFLSLEKPIYDYVLHEFACEKTLLTGIKNNLIEDKSTQKDWAISDCPIRQTLSAQFTEVQIPPETLFTHLSFTHFSLIMSVEDSFARTFYELETIKGVWTVRELKRQIETNYFERSAISSNPQKMSEYVQSKTQKMTVTDIIKHPYVYEFLGLKDSEIVEESELEQSLMNHLEEFLMCTQAGKELVEYTKEGIDENLFVKKYKLALPKESELTKWLKNEVKNFGGFLNQ